MLNSKPAQMCIKYVIALAITGTLSATGAQANVRQPHQNLVSPETDNVEKLVILPAQTDVAFEIKKVLANAYYTANPRAKSKYENAEQQYFFYGSRGFEPIWLTQDENGNWSFSDTAARIVTVFESAQEYGLRPEDYLIDQAAPYNALASNDPVEIAKSELAFTQVTLRYANHALGGRIDPRTVSRDITARPERTTIKDIMQLAMSDRPDSALLDMHPNHPEFVRLRAELVKRLKAQIEENPVIPRGRGSLRLGQSDPRVPILRQRLGVKTFDTDAPELFDEALYKAVMDYQTDNGLKQDGIVGPRTIADLNGIKRVATSDIIANMERWRWLPRDMDRFHVFVNVPQFRVEIRENYELVHTTRAIVGKNKHKTPIFSDEIEYLAVNPYWNVPLSILTEEMMGGILDNPSSITARGFEYVNASGRVINPSSIDWENLNPRRPSFRIRQRPSPRNALGRVKFMFPNQHAVYLHDTPTRSLFSNVVRAFSHGCVRVYKPFEFTEALLSRDEEISATYVRSLLGTRERRVDLSRKIPVHLVYFTLRVNDAGEVLPFRDIYGHNARLKRLLKL